MTQKPAPHLSLAGDITAPPAPSPRALVARQNAQKSTGPRTLAGKARASMNATRHGLTARAVVLPDLEDAADWDTHRDDIVAALVPIGALERELAERVAVLTWRLRRAVRAETSTVVGQLADAEAEAIADARPRDLGDALDAEVSDDGWAETFESLRGDATHATARAERHRRVYLAETEDAGATVVALGDLEVLVLDLASRCGRDSELVDLAMPGWRARRWTGREVLELAEVFSSPPDDPMVENAGELLRGAHLAAMLRADDARRRLEDAERRRARYVAERTIPRGHRGELLERYEGHLQRQLAMTLATLRAVRETFSPSTG